MVCGASESWADDGPALLLPCCPMVIINHGNSSMNCSGDKDRSMVHRISHTPRVLVWKWILYTITTLSSLQSGALYKRCPTHVIIMAEDDDVIKWKHFRVTDHLWGNSPVPGEFHPQRPVTRSFDVIFDLCPNKRPSKQWWGWRFETLSSPLWRHCNGCRITRITRRHADLQLNNNSHPYMDTYVLTRGLYWFPRLYILRGVVYGRIKSGIRACISNRIPQVSV